MIGTIAKNAIIFGAAGLIGVAAYQFLHRGEVDDGSFIQGQMPACNSTPVRRLIVKTIERSPRAKSTGLEIVRVGEVEDYADPNGAPASASSLDPGATLRFCKSVVYTNAGKGDFHFTLSWSDSSKAALWLQATVVTF